MKSLRNATIRDFSSPSKQLAVYTWVRGLWTDKKKIVSRVIGPYIYNLDSAM